MRFASLFIITMLTACGGSGLSTSAFDDPKDSSASSGDSASVGDSTADSATADSIAKDSTSPSDTAMEMKDTRPMCPPGVVKGGPCPDACSSCDGELCKITCNGGASCNGETINCPPGFRCRVSCTGPASCDNTTIHCADDAPCETLCTGGSSCSNLQVQCPTVGGACQLECGALSSVTCSSAAVHCGAGQCTSKCNGAPMTVDCGASCSCKKEGC